MSVIGFADKVSLKEDSSVPRVNKVTDNDINEIKNSVNALYETSLGAIFNDTVETADVLLLNSVPLVMAPAPGAGKINLPLSLGMKLDFGGIAYDTNTTLRLQYGSAVLVLNDFSNYLAATADRFTALASLGIGTINAAIENESIELIVTGGEALNGNSNLIISFQYRVVDFT